MGRLKLILLFQVHIKITLGGKDDFQWVDFHVLGGMLSHKFLTKNLSIRYELNPVFTALNELAAQLSLKSSVILSGSSTSDDSGSIIPKKNYNLLIWKRKSLDLTWNNSIQVGLLPCNHFQFFRINFLYPFLRMKMKFMLIMDMKNIAFEFWLSFIIYKLFIVLLTQFSILLIDGEESETPERGYPG